MQLCFYILNFFFSIIVTAPTALISLNAILLATLLSVGWVIFLNLMVKLYDIVQLGSCENRFFFLLGSGVGSWLIFKFVLYIFALFNYLSHFVQIDTTSHLNSLDCTNESDWFWLFHWLCISLLFFCYEYLLLCSVTKHILIIIKKHWKNCLEGRQ